MAGMIPGVELARRRRTTHSRQHDHNRYSRRDFFLPDRMPPSSTAITTSTVPTMGAAALKARTRLEEKLGSLRSRWNKDPQLPPPIEVKSSSQVLPSNQIHNCETEMRTRDIEVCRNSPQLSRMNSEREVCAVCLEELQGLREVTNLPCSHRYHSDCLLTWLASQSHCPCCRSLVVS